MKSSNQKTFFMFLMAFLVAFFIVSLVGVLRSSFTTSGAPEITAAQAVPALSDADAVIKTPLTFSESPISATGRLLSGLILINAISVLASVPITLASYSLPSDSFTRILSACSTT